jgi:hypothetical protein
LVSKSISPSTALSSGCISSQKRDLELHLANAQVQLSLSVVKSSSFVVVPISKCITDVIIDNIKKLFGQG